MIGLTGHSVAKTNRDLMALIAAAPEFQGAGFLVPTRNHEVFTWCLAGKLRLVVQWTLMTIGLYQTTEQMTYPRPIVMPWLGHAIHVVCRVVV